MSPTKVLQVPKKENEGLNNNKDKEKSTLDKTEKQKVLMDKLQEELVKRKGKIYDRKKDRKNEKEQGEENASKDKPRILRDTITQKDSVVD